MKKQISLSEVLTGRPTTTKTRKPRVKGTKNDTSCTNTTDMRVSEDKLNTEEDARLRTRHIEPIVNSTKEPVSLKSFLMTRPQKPKTTEVIDLDEDGDVISIENESITMNSKAMEPENFKKTSHREMFNNFEKKKKTRGKNNELEITNEPYLGYEKIRRYNDVSKLKELPTSLFPKVQLVAEKSMNIIDIGQEHFAEKRVRNRTADYNLSVDEYMQLNPIRKLNPDAITDIPVSVSVSDSSNSQKLLWNDMMAPKNIQDVLLEPKLKEDVFMWISSAFHKLKRPTTRNKLKKQTKNDRLRNEIEDFIVPDGMIVFGDDEDTTNSKVNESNHFDNEVEFVPLMILHGEGIGKNTLIKNIANHLNSQIYEVASNCNRGKKEIKEMLLEFSTTHYVKGTKDGIILIDDVDVIFREHDKFFWQALEKVLMVSRRPIILTTRDINFIPTYLLDICEEEKSIFLAKRVSRGTVQKMLAKYIEVLNQPLNSALIEKAIEIHGADVRGCLLDLQFLDGYKTGCDINTPCNLSVSIQDSNCINSQANVAELLSNSDIILNATEWNSNFITEPDSTLMTRSALEYNAKQSDDTLKLKNDYLVDYQLHLNDELRQQRLPFEINIGHEIYKILVDSRSHKTSSKPVKSKKYKIDKVVRASAEYLGTRIDSTQGKDRGNRARSSRRRIQEVLDRLSSNYEYSADKEDEIMMDLEMYPYSTLSCEINPMIHEIAKRDNEIKSFNRQLFESETKGLAKEEMNTVVYKLTNEGLLKPIFFRANPQSLLDYWK